jgi:CheY-like chemotaxis protein
MTRNKKKVLVVDDDELHLYTTKELLQDDRFDVVTHQHGFGVTSLMTQLQPDLVLLDINMPALSGDKLAGLLRTNSDTSHIPIVFYSSNDEDSLRECVAAHGVCGYICKGDIINLKRKVNRYLNLPIGGEEKDLHDS